MTNHTKLLSTVYHISSGALRLMTGGQTHLRSCRSVHQKIIELIHQKLISSECGQNGQYQVNGIFFVVNKGEKVIS
jgi:carbonic anhydrase